MPRKKTAEGEEISTYSAEELIEYFTKTFGENTLVLASDAVGIEIKHIPTGIHRLDFGLGGGFPQNRIIEIRGPFSSFKSTLTLVTMANFQKQFPSGFGVYVDAEKTFDGVYARKLGVELDRVLLVNPDSGEQAVDAVNKLMKWHEDLLIVIDSIAALVPTDEVDASMSQQFMGLHARLIGRLMRVATARLKRSMYNSEAPSTTVLAINQLRQKIGVMFGNPETTPGGVAKDFFYSTIIRLNASSAKANVITEEQTRNKIKRTIRLGQMVDFKVLKNKCGGPQHEEGQFTYYERPHGIYKAHEFDNVDALFEYGAFTDVITFDDSQGFAFKTLRAKQPGRFVKLLAERPKLQSLLYKKILRAQKEERETDNG